MNKPNKYNLIAYRRTLMKSAEDAHAKGSAIDSELPSTYYLGLEVAFLIAAAHAKFIETDDTSN